MQNNIKQNIIIQYNTIQYNEIQYNITVLISLILKKTGSNNLLFSYISTRERSSLFILRLLVPIDLGCHLLKRRTHSAAL